MLMHRLLILILLTIPLACVNPQKRLDAFNESWQGGHIDDFVARNGNKPANK